MRALSGGERQRVAIATALLQEAPLLLLDEPASHLDPAHQRLLLALLADHARQGGAVLASLHDLNLAWDLADHCIVLDGKGGAVAGPRDSVLTAERMSRRVRGGDRERRAARRAALRDRPGGEGQPWLGCTPCGPRHRVSARWRSRCWRRSRSAAQAAPIVAVDDAGRELRLERPPARIVTLAPSLTELVFAAGGGAAIVAVDSSSDFPAAARAIPRIGDVARIDVERLLALKPDLVARLAARQHHPRARSARGRRASACSGSSRSGSTTSFARSSGSASCSAPRRRPGRPPPRCASGSRRCASAMRTMPPVRVFYQVWSSPLMTISRKQIVSEVIELCGGRNVFAGLAPLVPQVAIESVLAADPEAIFTADERGSTALLRRDVDAPAFAAWRRHPRLAAVQGRWLYVLNGDAISRQGPRIVDGATAVCGALDEVRRERGAAKR